jgi:formylglycine-generating enzyme required for sulfatase activity
VERLGWAADGGADQFGRWASFEVDSVAQRMRWIVPGRFLMGSPEDEPGRFGDEGPRHEVKLTEGFWLGETPCTQELWQAVMGENPSYFKSPSRPVEGVSWDDCQRFFKRLNERLPQLGAGLSTEAQWEYACRGGMETATWLGNLEILGDNNAPLLDEIAWYGGNSGVRFDLENGVSSSDWPKKQYPHTRAGTREVGQKHPNPWGLYDMLGNVWEWCSDYWSDAYPGGPRTDPKGPDDGAGRVFRGGSWRLHARLVRAAYRYWLHPGVRYRHLGFRLSRGQGRIE